MPHRKLFRPASMAGVTTLGVLALWGLFYAIPVRMSEPQRDERPVAAASDVRPSPSAPRLAELLTDPSVQADDQAAFASLFSRWGIDPRKIPGTLGCDAENSQGLECITQVGNWTRLRRFDLPVLLELVLPGGEKRRVALVGLGEQTASLELSGRAHTFPLPEIEKLWDGSFILPWKPPPLGMRLLSSGMRGQDVAWVRRTLDSLEGKVPQSEVSGVYDAGLEQRVLAFQRSHSLVADGLVGKETLLQLTLATRGPETPSLSRPAP